MIAFTALSGIVSLSVDYGRVQLANAELQCAADAAARQGATGLSNGTTLAKAQSVASQNYVDGTPLVLQAADVQTGTWNSSAGTFTAGGSSPNAVRVTGCRTAARGTAISLLFARAIGKSSCDLTVDSIAVATPAGYDVVGLTSVLFGGTGKIRRDPAEGGGTVNVAGNGSWTITWGQQIAGNVYYRGSAPNPPSGANCITGAVSGLPADLVYATPTTPGGSIALGAVAFDDGTFPVPGGNYSATSVSIGGGTSPEYATVNFSGDVNLYCSGAVTVGNRLTLNTAGTTHCLTIYETTSAAVTVNTTNPFYARIYAPLSTVTITGATPFTGSIVAKNLVVSGTATVSYNSNLPNPYNSPSAVNVSYVK